MAKLLEGREIPSLSCRASLLLCMVVSFFVLWYGGRNTAHFEHLSHGDSQALAEYARDMEGDGRVSSADGSSSVDTAQNAEVAFLVGPEGGFDPDEISALAVYPFVRFVSLGPSVLRAETAVVYALSSWSAFWAARR